MSNSTSLSSNNDLQLDSGEDLAAKALEEAQEKELPAVTQTEAQKSDQFADTLHSLEGVIERHANQLEELKAELKERRQMLHNYFTNDEKLATAEEQVKEYRTEVKQCKSKLQQEPQVVDLKIKIKELKERRQEVEDTLSNHLINHHQLTNSTSFDTSEGDQWGYKIKAKVKRKPK